MANLFIVFDRLLIFFDGVECLSFELTETEDEDIVTAVGTRLNAVAPHATKVSFICSGSSINALC